MDSKSLFYFINVFRICEHNAIESALSAIFWPLMETTDLEPFNDNSQSLVVTIDQKMALRAFYFVICPQFLGRSMKNLLSAIFWPILKTSDWLGAFIDGLWLCTHKNLISWAKNVIGFLNWPETTSWSKLWSIL